jgi:hypothetical protein
MTICTAGVSDKIERIAALSDTRGPLSDTFLLVEHIREEDHAHTSHRENDTKASME